MGTRQLNRFTAKTVANKRKPGLYSDGGGHYLRASPSGSKAWIFRFRPPSPKNCGIRALDRSIRSRHLKAAVDANPVHWQYLLSNANALLARGRAAEALPSGP